MMFKLVKNKYVEWVSQVANAEDMRCGFTPRVGKIPWRGAWQPTPAFLPGGRINPTDRGAWWAMVHRVRKSMDTTEVSWHIHTQICRIYFKL